MTPWETQLLETLACCLRMLSVGQIARLWWPGQSRSIRNARDSVAGLKAVGWLETPTVLSRPVRPLESPLATWIPGDPAPDVVRLSRVLQRRASMAAHQTRVVTATRKTNECFGYGGLQRIKLTQVTHDLHVSEIFVRYSQLGWGGLSWVGEDRLGDVWPLRQRPDAVLTDHEQRLRLAIEFGGNYSAARLRRLHDATCRVGIGCEVW